MRFLFSLPLLTLTLAMVGCKPPAPTSNPTGNAAVPAAGEAPPSAAPVPSAAPAPASAAPAAEPVEDLAAVEPELKLNATELAKEVAANPQAAAAKYGGKVIEVEGPVFATDGRKTLDVGTSPQIDCRLAASDPTLWQRVARQSQVTLKGRFQVGQDPFQNTEGQLRNCVLVSHGPSPRLQVTAEELSNLARTNPAELERKYHSQQLLMVAEVGAFVPAQAYYDDLIVFKTSGAPRVFLEPKSGIIPKDYSPTTMFPVGKKVMVACEYDARRSNFEKEIRLMWEEAAVMTEENAQPAGTMP